MIVSNISSSVLTSFRAFLCFVISEAALRYFWKGLSLKCTIQYESKVCKNIDCLD